MEDEKIKPQKWVFCQVIGKAAHILQTVPVYRRGFVLSTPYSKPKIFILLPGKFYIF
ncbi:hypothetical protein [Rickettsia endosymbiont of Ceutorhynchus obstrictus]|uniref:hypothetical protein n=1 Tax=Rickettsia endosymbiont of Ceutorhynchus obstrictus TaxID=3066249 RepID=UPI0031331ABB